MRALPIALVLFAAAPALADTEAPAPAPPAAPIVPPAATSPTDAPPAEEPSDVSPTRYDYRFQVIGTDITTIALSFIVDRIASDGGSRPGTLATFTIASYFFVAPMIHGVHRQGKRALASFGLRAGLPLLLGVIGEHVDGTPKCSICQDTLRSDGKLIGLTAGALIAMAVDGVLLARPIYRRIEPPRAAWAPALTGVRGGATAGVLGTF